MASKDIPAERFSKAFFTILDETFEHHHGIFLDKGTSLFETLDRVSADVASRPVADGRPTIAAQVEHVTFYLDVLERYLRGENLGKVDWKEIWQRRSGVTSAEWTALNGDLRKSYERIQELLRNVDWSEDAVGGAFAVVVHTAYHLGQIRLTARSLGVADK